MKSDVYFIEVESSDIKERCAALAKLIAAAKPFAQYQKNEFIPIKLTIGDSACVYNISPELVKLIVTEIKKQKAKPFLFDTNVIYTGERMNAVDHLNLAQGKGFGHSKVGAPFIIADGLFGQDGREFEIDSPLIKKIRTASFVGMLDSLLVLSHITGHIVAGYAGAIKNVAMGMAARPTKQVQHSSLKPEVLKDKCVACGCCIEACPARAIFFQGKIAFIDQGLCIGCAECLAACRFYAINVNWEEDAFVFVQRMSEVAGFILSKFKNKFFINFAFDITQECDCLSNKNEKMLGKNIGILASRDIVALEQASLDLALGQGKQAYLERVNKLGVKMLEYARIKGLGSREYQLIKL